MSEDQTGLKWPANKVAAWLGVSATTCKDVCMKAGMDAKDGFDILQAAPAMVAYYKGIGERANRDAEASRAKKIKAEANIAEMEEAKLAGTLCLRADYLDNYEELIAQGVRAISELPGLTKAQKELVFAALRSCELPPLTESE